MRMGKKMMAGAFAGLMIISIMLAGCTKENTKSGQKETEKPIETDQAAVSATPTSLPEVKLTWYLRGSKPKNADSVIAKANELTKAKINATVDYKFVEPGDYDQKMQLIMASGESYDIAFTSNWSNNYVGNVDKGAYLALDDYLAKYPKFKQSIPVKVWNGVKVNGKIYGIFNYQILSLPTGFEFRKDLIQKYNINLDNVKKVSDLTPIFEQIKAKEPGIVPLKYGTPNTSYYTESGFPALVETFQIDTQTWKVGDYLWTSDNMMKHYQLMREWYQKGFFPANVATASEGDQALEKSGKLFSQFTGYKPGVEAELSEKRGYGVVTKSLTKAPYVGKMYSTVSAISKSSKNPERAFMLLEMINTDKDLYNLMTFGIENQDYKKTGPSSIEKTPDTYQFDAWMLGNQFNAYLLPGQPNDAWAQTMKLNESAEVDPLAEFAFDRTPVQNEIVQINAIYKEFNVILKNGLDDPDKIVKLFKEKLKQAGEEKVRSEIQKQLDQWLKGK
ncbi:DUF3502 domain-containing protein [Paenibacillus sp. LMG 31461]|uniref:DUF3502 domain-containing protein n=1 Tax=Paenibacillus plantarum TaxID=2654975 RepID=A0ABX1XD28_9BACL|nr:ABC transporter substrate-binding protein [Paenibacillus plantarum]NOU66081.1 DUF3502 domain-containing protein [Paenibacillus plantarum]